MNKELTRFLDAQNQIYLSALSEIKNGKKQSHWMWFVFPQMKGLGHSSMANFYGIENLAEAENYLKHPVLGKHLIEISNAVLNVNGKSASQIFGSPDDMKLLSSMTLFANVKNSDQMFDKVIGKYFNGQQDEFTLRLIVKDKFTHDTI